MLGTHDAVCSDGTLCRRKRRQPRGLTGPATCRPIWWLPAIPCYRNYACNSLRKHKDCRQKPGRPAVSRTHRTCCQRVRLAVMGHTHQSRQASACTLTQTMAAGQQTAEAQQCWSHDAAGALGAGCSVTMLVFHAHAAILQLPAVQATGTVHVLS
jgi:hypothetical protein